MYGVDAELFVLFENEMCLVIGYRYIDVLEVELREITYKEKEKFNDLIIKDFFNTSNDICDHITHRVLRNESCFLEYGSVKSADIRSVEREYEKWIGDSIILTQPTEETFDEIKFIMDNGKSITICPSEASDGGYIYVWSEDCMNSVNN